jgi:hypothetical protein
MRESRGSRSRRRGPWRQEHLALLLAPLLCLASFTSISTGNAYASGGSGGWARHVGTGLNDTPSQLFAGASGFLALAGTGASISPDGVTWKPLTGSIPSYALREGITDLNLARVGEDDIVPGDTACVKAASAHGPFVAVGSYHRMGALVTKTRAEVAFSHNGKSWTTVSTAGPVYADAAMTGVAYGHNGWVAVGYEVGAVDTPIVWLSPDGTHWRRAAHPPVARYDQLAGVFHGPHGYLAVASGLDGVAGTWASSDGQTWTGGGQTELSGAIIGQLAASGTGWLATGQQDGEPAVWSSADGVHWRRAADGRVFTGGQTMVQGIARKGNRIVVAGWYGTVSRGAYGTRFGPRSAASWTHRGTNLTVPAGHSAAVDAMGFRLRESDIPGIYANPEPGGWTDLCDDVSTLCRAVHNAVGSFDDYGLQYEGAGGTTVQSMTIHGTRARPHAAVTLGSALLHWWDRSGVADAMPSPGRIGDETVLYRDATSRLTTMTGAPARAYEVVWRRSADIGVVYVAEPATVRAATIERLAVTLARRQFTHLAG